MKEYQYSELILSPREIKKLVNTDIAVETKSEQSLRGYLKTIDPVSNTLVLQMQTNNDKQVSIQLIPSHAIRKVISYDKKIEELDKKSFEQLVQRKQQLSSMNAVQDARRKIQQLLEKNKLPSKLDELDGSIIVGDTCKIKTPYREQDIECANYKVSKNLRTILKDAFLNEEAT